MTFDRFKSRVERAGPVHKDGRGWRGRCPCHDDDGKRGDLSFEERDGRILLHCWKGCDAKSIVGELGLKWSDLFLDGKPDGERRTAAPNRKQRGYQDVQTARRSLAKRFKGRFTQAWRYEDTDGNESFHVLRFDDVPGKGKDYRPIHREDGRYVVGDPPGQLPLYNLVALLAQRDQVVYVAEGEKCGDVLASLGLLSTTSAHGAHAADKSDWTPLAGRDVVIVPDNNADGERYADDVSKLLLILTPPAKVRILRLPDLRRDEDIADWIEKRDAVETDTLRARLEELAKAIRPVTAGRAAGMEAVYVSLDTVEAKDVHWLWQDHFPSAMLSLLIGVEGNGKTFVSLDMAAHVTTGTRWPDGVTDRDCPTAGNVVFLTSEDHLAYTVRPRLDAMKADVSRVFALKGVRTEKGEEFFDVLRHLSALEDMIQKEGDVRLVIVDPLTAFLGTTDQHRNGEVRTALSRFSAVAERYGCAVVGISHLCKDASKAAIHRTIGSVAFSAAARAVWLVAQDKRDEERRLLVPVKCNLSKLARSLAFRIRDNAVDWEPGQFDYDADEILALDRDQTTALDEAVQWLRELLADGRMQAKEVQRLAKQNGIAETTLRRAKKVAGIVAKKEGIGPASVWCWRLRDEN